MSSNIAKSSTTSLMTIAGQFWGFKKALEYRLVYVYLDPFRFRAVGKSYYLVPADLVLQMIVSVSASL